jgi:hypothetical protein
MCYILVAFPSEKANLYDGESWTANFRNIPPTLLGTDGIGVDVAVGR